MANTSGVATQEYMAVLVPHPIECPHNKEIIMKMRGGGEIIGGKEERDWTWGIEIKRNSILPSQIALFNVDSAPHLRSWIFSVDRAWLHVLNICRSS